MSDLVDQVTAILEKMLNDRQAQIGEIPVRALMTNKWLKLLPSVHRENTIIRPSRDPRYTEAFARWGCELKIEAVFKVTLMKRTRFGCAWTYCGIERSPHKPRWTFWSADHTYTDQRKRSAVIEECTTIKIDVSKYANKWNAQIFQNGGLSEVTRQSISHDIRRIMTRLNEDVRRIMLTSTVSVEQCERWAAQGKEQIREQVSRRLAGG